MHCTNEAFHKIATVITKQDFKRAQVVSYVQLWSFYKSSEKFLLGCFYTLYIINTIFIEILGDILKFFNHIL